MRPLQCHAGFPLPLTVGKIEICGIRAIVSNTAAAARITIIDDMGLPRDATLGRILTEDNQKVTVIDIKGIADVDSGLVDFFPEPIKLNRGASVTNASNLIGGKVMLYIR